MSATDPMKMQEYIERAALQLSGRFDQTPEQITQWFQFVLSPGGRRFELPRWMQEPVHLAHLHRSPVDLYGVMVTTKGDANVCLPCQALKGTILTLDEALREAPLPHAACENYACRCHYLPMKDCKHLQKAERR